MAFLTQSEWNASEKYNGLATTLKWPEVPGKKTIFSLEKKDNAKYETYILHFTDANKRTTQHIALHTF